VLSVYRKLSQLLKIQQGKSRSLGLCLINRYKYKHRKHQLVVTARNRITLDRGWRKVYK
jgi:hypothetical protein